MTDEKYIFIQDSKEKKRTARGAMYQRSHCGKSGAVKFPSDYLSRKELKAMNGKCETYNLNKPMKWDEFKTLPDHIKSMYVESLRKKFDVTNTAIAEMLGVQKTTVSRWFKCCGIPSGYRGNRGFDEAKWQAWLNGELVNTEQEAPEISEDIPVVDETVDICDTEAVEVEPNKPSIIRKSGPVPFGTTYAVPVSGDMTFECPANEALLTLIKLLDNAKVELHVSWTVVD